MQKTFVRWNKKHCLLEQKKTFDRWNKKHLFVGTQDLCVQSNKTGSNKTGSNKTIPILMITLDETLDWTGRKDLASLQTNDFLQPTNKCATNK
jgi:hypothetical protein